MSKSGFIVVILAIAFLIFSPVIVFCWGWCGGWILMQVIGTTVTNGLNILFDTTRFTPDLIPVTCGALAVIGSYFKTSVSSSKG